MDFKECQYCSLSHPRTREYWHMNSGVLADCKQKRKDWYKINKDQVRLYRLKNQDLIRIKKREYNKKKRILDISFRILESQRTRLRRAMSTYDIKKTHKTIDLLGCSISELRQHLETQFQPGMTWQNHSVHGWHIDHIIPFAKFDLKDPEQLKKACHYTNLQPLWAGDNLSKGAA